MTSGIEAMLEHGTYLVADIYDGDHIAVAGRAMGWPEETLRKNELTTDAQRDGFRKALAAGVRIAYGTDSGVYPHADVARQLSYYGPLRPVAALDDPRAPRSGPPSSWAGVTESAASHRVGSPTSSRSMATRSPTSRSSSGRASS